MGVHGFTPFLRKAYPTVIRNLPNRFAGLRGKRIIIDGTLLTQRFHFAQDNHPHRHIISWYRFAQELQEHDVSAICLFDGKQRNKAKAREIQRRHEARELEISRSFIEQDRFTRLVRVKKTLHSFEQLDDSDKRKVGVLLTADPSFRDAESPAPLQDLLGDSSESTIPLELPPPLTQDALPLELPLPSTQDALPSEPPGEDLSPVEKHVVPKSKAVDVAAQIKSSFLGFKANVANLVALSVDQPQTSTQDAPSEEEQVEKVMSKSQHGLAVNESKFWKNCITTLTSDPPLETPLGESGESQETTSPGDELESLVDRSCIMASMYERRTNLPTQETYSEAREILRALGIPCIKVVDAYEAEALASSMVLAGLADYVVSEDTDVLVYEAPLVRNMTTRDPFFLVCGTDVRRTLQLTRDQYIDFAILLGTDFSQRITNVGPVRALNLIKELGCIEHVVDLIESHPKYHLKLPRAAYLAQVDIARSVFKTLPPLPSEDISKSVERSDALAAGILQKYGILLQDISSRQPYWRHEDALVGNYYKDIPIAT